MVASFQESKELSEVLARIQSWSNESRLALMKGLAESLSENPSPQVDPDDDAPTIEELEGILDSGGQSPSDDMCERWLEEARMRKYG